jgi:hypothetical protein
MEPKEEDILAERYGVKITKNSRRNRTLAIVALSLFTLSTVAVGLVNWSPVQATDIGFRVQSPWLTELDFELQMPMGRIAECEFEALNNNFAQVGFVTKSFGPFETGITTHTVQINTYEEAVTGLVRGCVLR